MGLAKNPCFQREMIGISHQTTVETAADGCLVHRVDPDDHGLSPPVAPYRVGAELYAFPPTRILGLFDVVGRMNDQTEMNRTYAYESETLLVLPRSLRSSRNPLTLCYNIASQTKVKLMCRSSSAVSRDSRDGDGLKKTPSIALDRHTAMLAPSCGVAQVM
jgi:hypothetical protein